MRTDFIKKIKQFPKSWVFWALIIIAAIAIIIRSIPAWFNMAWGCDFGIYLGLTKSMIASGELYNPYVGWGSSYQYFPISYLITSTVHWITGIDVLVLMPKIGPIFGGISVLFYYFVFRELTENKKVAIISTLLVAVLPFHFIQTSHTSPLTMGHFFLPICMFYFIKFRKNTTYIFPLLIFNFLLIMSHHLTTYFFVISLIGIVLIENIRIKEWTPTIRKDIIYISISSLLMFGYWAFVAITVFESFMGGGFSFAGFRPDPIYIILLFYATIFFMILFLRYIKKRLPSEIIEKDRSAKRYITKFLIGLIVAYTCIIIFTFFVELPLIGINLTPEAILFITPLIIIACLAVAGFGHVFTEIRNGTFIIGWTFSIIFSFLFSFATNNGIIIPHRHFEYLMAPLAILAVYGLGGIFSDPDNKKLLTKIFENKNVSFWSKTRNVIISYPKRILHLIIILALVISLAYGGYPSHVALNVSDERISAPDIMVFEWMDNNLDKNISLIASDHRLARMAEAYGFNTTKDKTEKIWDAEEIDEYIIELLGIGKNHSRITHILVDNIMRDEVVHVYLRYSCYMTNSTWTGGYDKFQEHPFEKIYRNETTEMFTDSLEPVFWAEVYEVNWSYLDKYYLPNMYKGQI